MKNKIKEFLRDIFAPKIYYYGEVKNQEQMNKISQHMNKSFKEMDKAFEQMSKIFDKKD